MDYKNFHDRYDSFVRVVPEMEHDKVFRLAVAGLFFKSPKFVACPYCDFTTDLDSTANKVHLWITNRYVATSDAPFYQHLKYCKTRGIRCDYLSRFYTFLDNDLPMMTTERREETFYEQGFITPFSYGFWRDLDIRCIADAGFYAIGEEDLRCVFCSQQNFKIDLRSNCFLFQHLKQSPECLYVV